MTTKIKSGVYYLVHDNSIVYIGSAGNIDQRILKHNDKIFDKIVRELIEDEKIYKKREVTLIKKHLPIYNNRGIPKDLLKPFRVVKNYIKTKTFNGVIKSDGIYDSNGVKRYSYIRKHVYKDNNTEQYIDINRCTYYGEVSSEPHTKVFDVLCQTMIPGFEEQRRELVKDPQTKYKQCNTWINNPTFVFFWLLSSGRIDEKGEVMINSYLHDLYVNSIGEKMAMKKISFMKCINAFIATGLLMPVENYPSLYRVNAIFSWRNPEKDRNMEITQLIPLIEDSYPEIVNNIESSASVENHICTLNTTAL